MSSRAHKKSYLFVDAVIAGGMIYITSLMLEYIKVGLISNTIDLNILLVIFLVGLVTSLIIDTGGYAMPFSVRLLYSLWGLLLVALFVRVFLGLTSQSSLFFEICGVVVVLTWLVAWYYQSSKKINGKYFNTDLRIISRLYLNY